MSAAGGPNPGYGMQPYGATGGSHPLLTNGMTHPHHQGMLAAQ